MVCRHYDIRAGNIPVSHDVNGIIEVLKTFGFYAAEIHTGMRGLADAPKPAIAQTVTGFMTILDASKISVKITYGDNEIHRIASLDFMKIWTGLVIVIEPPPVRKWSFLRNLFD